MKHNKVTQKYFQEFLFFFFLRKKIKATRVVKNNQGANATVKQDCHSSKKITLGFTPNLPYIATLNLSENASQISRPCYPKKT